MAPQDHVGDEEAPSTGFLPITLALGLFVTGLFVLGFVPGLQCHPDAAAEDRGVDRQLRP
jgi:hypothetical protein